MMDQERAFFKVRIQFEEMLTKIKQAVKEGHPINEVEKDLWHKLLSIGRSMLQGYVDQQGDGDVGSRFDYKGRTWRRLESRYERRYVSVFGEIKLVRAVYGTRENQKHEVVPLDARLNLPESDFSYLLQDWSQAFCVQGSYKQASRTVERILELGQAVRSLEQMNRKMAEDVEDFQKTQPTPPPEEEGSILVTTADGKGVPMRREPTAETGESNGRRKKGEKAQKKRQSCVGAVYTIDPFPRIPEDVVDEILREKQKEKRPVPLHKRMRAKLTRPMAGEEINGKDQIFSWFEEEIQNRNTTGNKAVVCIMDGERGLWKKTEAYEMNVVRILDIYHVLERLWSAAYCFTQEGSEEAQSFVAERLTRILQGDVGRVIGGLRQMGTKHNLRGRKKKQLEKVITYLVNNRGYMHYDYYLEWGYPIGSGVVEGACRHLVKDRMELTGMRWRIEGAQSMLDLRAVYLNDDWENFQEHRIQKHLDQRYPYRDSIQEIWDIAA